MRKLIFTPLFVVGAAVLSLTACGDDTSEGSGGAGGTGSTSNATTGTGTTAATGTGGGTTSTGTGGSTTTGTGGAAAAGYCGQTCTTPADCCPDGVPGCPGEYPYNYTCDNGVCGFPQCATDDQCTFDGALPDYKCLTASANGTDYKFCSEACATDADCTAPLTCTGLDENDVMYCTSAPGPGCTADADCGGYGVCNLDTGACYCDDAADCTAAGVDTCVE